MNRLSIMCLSLLSLLPLHSLARDGGYAHIDSLISKMTVEEKVRMCFGGDKFGEVVIQGVPRLDVPPMYPCDGPRGVVRGPQGPATSFPSGIGLASSWNETLAEKVGEVVGKEARYYGVSLIFGPAINLNRDVLGGRFFEYLSEDPVLSGRMGGAEAKGIQNMKVAACLKHFAVNGRDVNRGEYSSNVDERTMRELYLRNYEIALKKSDAWTFMTAANKYNHDYCSDSKFLLNDVLKGEWGFKGLVLTDFCNTRSTVKAAFAGLDIGMPWGDYATTAYGKPLADAVESGKVPMSVLDDMARRILWVKEQVGLLDGVKATDGGEVNTPAHQALALKAAQESLVLLKNNDNILPIDASKTKNIVVMGPNADKRFCIHILGGSSGVQAAYEVTALAGIKKIAEKSGIKVNYLPLSGTNDFKPISGTMVKNLKGGQGFSIKYFDGKTNKLIADTVADKIDFNWLTTSPYPGKVEPGYVRIECEGDVTMNETGFYTFRVSNDCPTEFWAADMGAMAIRNLESGTPQMATTMLYMEAGKPYRLRMWYGQNPQGVKSSLEMNHWHKEAPSILLEYAKPATPQDIARQLAQYSDTLKDADYVVFVGGTDHTFDGEGKDRATMDFPEGQAELIKQLCAMQPHTIVTLYNGSPLTMDWMRDVNAVLEAFFPGMEGGTAIAQALFGEMNPAGKLSFTWPKRLKDTSAYAAATQDFNNVNYEDGLLMGYRWNDAKKIEPAFPFGYGLSYTEYKYSDLKTKKNANGTFTLTFKIKNTGNRAGDEIAQLYVGQQHCKYARPLKELKDFCRVSLKPGESKTVTFTLGDENFNYWNPDLRAWHVDSDSFEVSIGKSSRDIVLSTVLSVNRR